MRAYVAMWADMTSAARTANYQDPVLARHAAGAALSTLVRGLYSYRQHDWVIKGTPVPHARVTSLMPATDPIEATVLDCLDDTHWLIYERSGTPVAGTGGGHRKVTATVQDSDGAWKVTQLNAGVEGSC